MEALFAAWKDALKLEVIDKAKGEVLVHFLPLEADKKKAGPPRLEIHAARGGREKGRR